MRIGIALGGGGARGIAHFSILRVLHEEGIIPSIYAGTSAGSFAGALWGLYGFEGSIELIREQVRKGWKDKIKTTIPKRKQKESFFGHIVHFIKEGFTYTKALAADSVMSGDDLMRTLDELFQDKKFEDLPYKFLAASLDIVTGRDIIFESGFIKDAVYASSAIPGLFPPSKLDNFRLVDGGPTMKVPVEALILKGADFVIGVDVGSPLDSIGVDGKALEILMRADRLASRKLHNYLLSLCDFVIRPDLGDMTWMDFDKIDFAIKRGENAAKKVIKELKKRLKSQNFIKRWIKKMAVRHLPIEENKIFLNQAGG